LPSDKNLSRCDFPVSFSAQTDCSYVPVKLKPYRPSIRSLQEDFARRIALRRMKKRAEKGAAPVAKAIADNSEPWLPDPDSVSDFLEIARMADKHTRTWQSRLNNSSTD
jgi:hypothetical protein